MYVGVQSLRILDTYFYNINNKSVMNKLFLTVGCALLASAINAQTVTSPDGNVKVNLSISDSGQPM